MKIPPFIIVALFPLSIFAEQPTNQAILELLQKLNDRIEALEKKLEQKPALPTVRPQDPERKLFGMNFSRGPKGNRVSSVFEGSPADKAGFRPGDLITEVDGEDVTSLTSGELLLKLETKDGFTFTVVPKNGEAKKLRMEKKRQADFALEGGGFRLVGGRVALSEVAIGDVAPDFQATSRDGKPVRLHELKDKVVLVNFTATWCQPCREELPELLRIYRENREKGFEILSVFLDHRPAEVERYVKEHEIPWPVLIGEKGWESAIAREYGISGVPTNPLVVEGKIAEDSVRGRSADSTLKKYLRQ